MFEHTNTRKRSQMAVLIKIKAITKYLRTKKIFAKVFFVMNFKCFFLLEIHLFYYSLLIFTAGLE